MLLVGKKMRVLIIPSWYKGKNASLQGGVFHSELARQIQQKIGVAIYYPFDRTLHESYTVDVEEDLLTFRSFFQPSQRIRNRVRILKSFRKIIKEFNPDVIHAQVATEAGRYAIILGLLYKKPVIITEHSTMECSGVDKGIGRIYGKFVYFSSCYNTCVSEDLQRKLEKEFPKCEFHTIYNGITVPKISSHRYYRRENTINIILIAFMYSIDLKGIQHVLPALKDLMAEGYKITFHIIGDGNYKEYFENMANECMVSEDCVFYGACDRQKVFDILSEMDFLISASLMESFGCSLAEAMLLGKPVLATKSGGPESFVNDKVGILIEKGSKDAIVFGIKEMISKLNTYNSEEIKKYAYDKFEMTSICKQYIQIYEKIIKGVSH